MSWKNGATIDNQDRLGGTLFEHGLALACPAQVIWSVWDGLLLRKNIVALTQACLGGRADIEVGLALSRYGHIILNYGLIHRLCGHLSREIGREYQSVEQ